MNVVTDMRTTQRTCKRTSGRVTYEWTDVFLRVDGRVSACTCVRWHVHSSRARTRTKIKSTQADLFSVRLRFSLHTFSIGKLQTYRKKVSLSRLYFRTCARTWRVNVSTHVHTLTCPLVRTSVQSYVARPLVHLHVCWVVRTSVTTFICTRHQTYALQDHYLFWDFKKYMTLQTWQT